MSIICVVYGCILSGDEIIVETANHACNYY